jgi:hypothetical protein
VEALRARKLGVRARERLHECARFGIEAVVGSSGMRGWIGWGNGVGVG